LARKRARGLNSRAPEPLPDLESMTRADLDEFADRPAVLIVSGARTKADIIEAIEAAV
jgi:hypothetical protein